jgi:hypothetical protein
LGKRTRATYDRLDEEFYESNFKWNEEPNKKKVTLDTPEDRNAVLNARPSFTNLVASASLILPPEMDTVVISRDQFVVEWNQDGEELLPPTQVIQVLGIIGKNSFKTKFTNLLSECLYTFATQLPRKRSLKK